MEEEVYREPKYTMRWLMLQVALMLVVSIVLAAVANGISAYAFSRQESSLLTQSSYNLIDGSTTYCFALMVITLMSVTLIEIAFRRSINLIQYGLIGCALCLFYLLLLAMSEQMPFMVAYIVVTVMTAGLITLFIKGITQQSKAIKVTASILVAEYAVMLLLIYLGSLALLVGSLLLFAILALAMYFTLKLRMENEEIVLK